MQREQELLDTRESSEDYDPPPRHQFQIDRCCIQKFCIGGAIVLLVVLAVVLAFYEAFKK